MKRLTVILIGVAVLGVFLGLAMAQDKPAKKFDYVGAEKCKVCHKPQYDSWLQTKHAKAFESLSAEDQKKAECVKCHITGNLATGEVVTGVQCEACHGAGSEYRKPSIMSKKNWAAEPDKYKAMAVEAGLIYPVAKDCTRCHQKEGNPHFKEFDFEKTKGLVHPVKAEGAK